ncbi:MAG: hypothetical protein ACREU6_17665 [Steroidobacteraceae bacterium]
MRIRLVPAAAAIVALYTAPALADRDPNSGAPLPPSQKHETPSPITDRFYVRGIYYAPHVKTILRVDPHGALAGQVGTTLSAERDLGQDSRLNQGRIEMMFRLRARNKIRVDFLEVDRTATHQLGQPINFGEEAFPVSALLASEIDWRIFGLTYTYSIFHNDRFELGTGVGIHLLQAEAQAQVNATRQRQDVSGAGAFPTVPLDFAFRISQRFSVTARAQYFHASLSSFDGWLADVHEDVQYRWKPNFSLGVGYSSIRAKLALNTGSFPGGFALSLEGPEAFFRVSF